MKELKLNKPIRAHGEDIHVLELREPTGKDVRELGFPYMVSGDGGVRMDAGGISKYISRLAGIPPSSVDEMLPADLNAISWEVVSFFLRISAPDNS